MTDLYDRLELPRNASDAQIKSAYRSKARELHPDRNASEDTTAQFQEILTAYEILIDPNARAEYDATGRLPGQRDPRDADEDLYESFASFSFGFGFGPFQSSRPMRRAKAASSTIELDIDLKDFFLGRTFKFDIKKKVGWAS
jgi:DnaJ family protein A protein 2